MSDIDYIKKKVDRIYGALGIVAAYMPVEVYHKIKRELDLGPEIDWEKAIQNGAYRKEFLFSNDLDFKCGVQVEALLIGYTKEHEHPFSAVRYAPLDASFPVKRNHFKYCTPIPGTEIPESWLKDD